MWNVIGPGKSPKEEIERKIFESSRISAMSVEESKEIIFDKVPPKEQEKVDDFLNNLRINRYS